MVCRCRLSAASGTIDGLGTHGGPAGLEALGDAGAPLQVWMELRRDAVAGSHVTSVETLGLPADLRDCGIGAQILADLGLTSIRLLTNNPKKIHGLEGYGLTVTDQIVLRHPSNAHNAAYLPTKAERMGHGRVPVRGAEHVGS